MWYYAGVCKPTKYFVFFLARGKRHTPHPYNITACDENAHATTSTPIAIVFMSTIALDPGGGGGATARLALDLDGAGATARLALDPGGATARLALVDLGGGGATARLALNDGGVGGATARLALNPNL